MQKNKAIKISLLIMSFFVPMIASAVTLENNYPTLPGGPSISGNGVQFFLYAFNFLLYIGGGVAIAAIIYQGINMLISTGDMAKISIAKDRIKAALFGLVLLLGSFTILYTINPELTKINLPSIDVTNGIRWNTVTPVSHGVSYKEIPLGSIIESILIPDSTTKGQLFNYSQMINKTEEQCYLYDKDGNTIDRNNDGKIDESDAVEGLDMSICMDNLLIATERKIALFNGNNTICNGNIANTDGPINAMKAFIRDKTEGCSEKNCALWPEVTFPAALPDGTSGWPNGCKTIDPFTRTCTDSETGDSFDVTGTACQSVCGCCGGPRGSTAGTSASCQATPPSPFYETSTYADRDPCKNRQKIDCARQEMNFRMSGTGLGLGLKCAGVYDYSPDIAPFIDEDNNKLKIIDVTGEDGQTYKAEFLTFKDVVDFDSSINLTGNGRLYSFKKYFDNRIADLNAARDAINNDKTKNVLSLAEFQTLQDNSKDSISIDLFTTANNVYDSISYRSFQCTGYIEGSQKNLCNKGELVTLQNAGWPFLPGENITGVTTSGEGTAMSVLTSTDTPVDTTVYSSDHQAKGWPFKNKRIWNNKLAALASTINDLHNSGDPATLYVLSNPGTTDPTKYPEAARAGIIDNSPTKNACTLTKGDKQTKEKDQINKQTLISRIPIGELADGLSSYVTELDGIIDSTANEVKNVIYSADQIANKLPESCNCTNATNEGVCNGGSTSPNSKCPATPAQSVPQICDSPSCPDAPAQTCGTPACTACVSKKQNVCDFGCLDCGTTSNIDSAYYYCLMRDNYRVGDLPNTCSDAFLSGGQCGVNAFFRNTGCGVTTSSGKTDIASILQSASNITITGNHCSCQSNAWYLAPGDTCRAKLFGKPSYHQYGPVCSSDNVASIRADGRVNSYNTNFQLLNMGSICQCTFNPYTGGQCYNPLTNQPLNCTPTQLSDGEFTLDSDCGAIAGGLSSSGCLNHANSVGYLGPFWTVLSCTGNKMKIKPTQTVNITTCEEDATDLTPEEQQAIQDANTKTLQWSADDPNLLTYSGLNCCSMYYTDEDYQHPTGISNVLKVPSGFTATCAINFTNGASSIRINKEVAPSGATTKPVAKQDTQPYYVCPYNEIKTQQSRIYKRVASPTLTGLSGWGTNQDCLDDVPGFLQRIETWQQRLWNFQYAIDLLPTDENRFTLLDTLNVSRSRFNQCVQGFGQAYKEATTSTYLFTCEEGISAQKLGSLLILPEFPPHNSLVDDPNITSEMWNCYPFNSSRLNSDQKTKCFYNKDKNSECQEYIRNYTNDFYCCQGAQ